MLTCLPVRGGILAGFAVSVALSPIAPRRAGLARARRPMTPLGERCATFARMTKRLADETYINLETFKRDGSGVKTPVWCAPLEDKIVIFTEADSFKVKRLRRDPRIRAAACDVRGKVRGTWQEGSGIVVDSPDREARAYEALHEKYGQLVSDPIPRSQIVAEAPAYQVTVFEIDPYQRNPATVAYQSLVNRVYDG